MLIDDCYFSATITWTDDTVLDEDFIYLVDKVSRSYSVGMWFYLYFFSLLSLIFYYKSLSKLTFIIWLIQNKNRLHYTKSSISFRAVFKGFWKTVTFENLYDIRPVDKCKALVPDFYKYYFGLEEDTPYTEWVAWTKWPIFYRQYLKMQFHSEKSFNFDKRKSVQNCVTKVQLAINQH